MRNIYNHSMGKTQDNMRLEAIEHSDGRFWLRKNGRIIYEDLHRPAIGELAKLVFRKVGGTLGKAFGLLSEAMDKPILMKHPQFVRPYESPRV